MLDQAAPRAIEQFQRAFCLRRRMLKKQPRVGDPQSSEVATVVTLTEHRNCPVDQHERLADLAS